ncbi:MAG: DUF1684 domain-containing protein [Alphaproteobacteria bacterium]|nr:DUF1684 domain-containing protein [Alphaproteobacteria bacterium]
MRRFFSMGLGFAALGLLAAGPSPEALWKAAIADANKDYAAKPHAILKIQDAAYLREGDTSTLVGIKGRPESYRWVKGQSGKGILIAGVRKGHPFVVKDKQLYAEKDIAKGIAVDSGVDIAGQPTQVDAGVVGARIWVFNQQNKSAKDFKGLSYFPYDPSYIVTATFTPDPKRPARVFRTSRGTGKQFYHAGDASFMLKGKSFTLPFFTDSDDPADMKSLSAFFTDNLTGKETYGAGRYVDVDDFGPFPPKTFKIDFNYAYNPNCARSAFYTCPYAVDNLAIDIRAGEKDPHKAHG